MNKRGKDLVMLVIALCIYLGCIGLINVFPSAKAEDATAEQVSKEEAQKAKEEAKKLKEMEKQAKAEAKQLKAKETKAQQAEMLKDQKEQAERVKREKEAIAKQKAEARAQAEVQSKELAQIDAQSKAQAKAEIEQAKSEMAAANDSLKQKYDALSAQVQSEMSNLKTQYQQDKSALTAEYKDKIANAPKEDQAALKEELSAKSLGLSDTYKQNLAALTATDNQQKAEYSEQKTVIEVKYKEQVAKANAKAKHAQALARAQQITLAADNTPKMNVKEVKVNGNILVGMDEIVAKMPLVYNASDMPTAEADPAMLYDFKDLSEVILEPGQSRQISARTMQGFAQYILSLYQARNYAGIYVYVPKSAMASANQLVDDVLVIEVLEAPVTDVTVTFYDPEQNQKEKGYLKKSAVEKWSPVKQGEVANQKELDDYVNLLNQNPDRYVSATVTKGAQPNSLAVAYDVYEANPWHYFIQVDNSGTRDRQWNPKVGVINTNLLGVDDTFAAVFQGPWDSEITEEYGLFGSYDIPIAGPKLRLKVYAGYSQYNSNPDAGPFNFYGSGHFVGSELRYNMFQTDSRMPLLGSGWFFDVKGMLEYDRSKVSVTEGVEGSDVRFWMWGWGMELHKKTDLATSTFGFDYWQSGMGQSNSVEFGGVNGTGGARQSAKSDFAIYDFTARHSQFLDKDKINRLTGSAHWIGSNERLVSAKMTSFGGMYTVRGYDEDEIVADGGILASIQYEYDLIAADKAKNPPQDAEQAKQQEKENPLFIKRAAPLAFFDYGRTTINHPNPVTDLGEARHEELISIGLGFLLDIGNNLSSSVTYGYPLIDTPDTHTGKGRLNCSFMLRW